MLDVLDQDYIRTARAKGLSEWRTVGRHAFRNTLVSVVTVSGIILSLLIGGSVVIEQVFALPGIGRLVVQGIIARDYPLVQGAMLLLGEHPSGFDIAGLVLITAAAAIVLRPARSG
jgi:peptide/nickel transport system permease protein